MKKIIFVVILIIILIVIYARYIGINGLEVNEYTIEDSSLPVAFEDLKIVQFSDTLYNEHFNLDDFDKLINEINSLEPDIVFFTGDLIDDLYSISDLEKSEIIKYLSSIETSLYKFAIYGDNDLKDTTLYKSIMDDSNFILLDNKTYPLFYLDNTPITITGLTNTDDLTNSYLIDETITSSFNITLIHEPDLVNNITNESVFITGHSLGGYINLPFIGSIIKKDNAKIYSSGYYEDMNIYVSNGLGIEDYTFRLLNTPSINLFRLKSTNES